jgi:hypothetical protein
VSDAVKQRLASLSADHLGARIRLVELEDICADGITKPKGRRRHLRWPIRYGISSEALDWISCIAGLARDRIEVRDLIWKAGVRFLINGLEFARLTEGRSFQIEYGVRERSPLMDGSFDGLKDLVQRILTFRSPDSPDRRHPLYRLRTEAWLEAQLRRDIRVLDPSLDPTAVYSQVPAWRGEERSVLDLLTIDARGRLVVIEIKASEDVTLPLQGLDYWLSVEESRRRGEFERRGFFPGRNIANEPPVLWLVFPELRVHRSFRTISSSISSDIEVVRIALGGDWRRQVRVRGRERVNKGM